MARTLTFNINLQSNADKIAGQMTVSMGDLERAMEAAAKSTQKLDAKMKKMAELSSVTVIIDGAQRAMNQMSSMLSTLTQENWNKES